MALTAVTVDGETAGVQRAPPEEPPLAAPVATPAAIADAGFYAYWAHMRDALGELIPTTVALDRSRCGIWR